MKERGVFPYRRSNKKRGKGGGGGGGGNNNGRRMRDGGRRVPGSAHELLPMLQPATKALAQMLAGNTKPSGQLVHARNILGQAERLIDDRSAERLPPSLREDFFEHVARLKLTLADADVEDEAQEDLDDELSAEPQEAAPPVTIERLRELALSLATTPARPAYAPPIEPASSEGGETDAAAVEDEPEEDAAPERPRRLYVTPTTGARSSKLRLKSSSGDAEGDPAPASPSDEAATG